MTQQHNSEDQTPTISDVFNVVTGQIGNVILIETRYDSETSSSSNLLVSALSGRVEGTSLSIKRGDLPDVLTVRFTDGTMLPLTAFDLADATVSIFSSAGGYLGPDPRDPVIGHAQKLSDALDEYDKLMARDDREMIDTDNVASQLSYTAQVLLHSLGHGDSPR